MPRRLSWLLACLCLACGLAGACSGGTASPRFPHSVHLAELKCGKPGQPECLSCNNCHAVSEKDRAHKLPSIALCESCHRDDAHEVARVFDTKPVRLSGPIHFDHPTHLKMKGVDGQCVPCHGGVVEGDRAKIPPMSQCLGCHEHEQQFSSGQCTPCHDQSAMAKTLPKTFLRHDAAFAVRHGVLAGQERELCQSCHTQETCDACHDVTQDLTIERRQPERIQKNFVHRGDFMTRHAIEAQSQPARCARCHTQETCDSCHIERGVSAARLGARNPHPPGWVGTNAKSLSFHGRAARRDILACASCHDQGPATNCIRCHKVGAYGGNPHPGGWKSSRSESSAMCRYCHE